jgi:hypothetical protein
MNETKDGTPPQPSRPDPPSEADSEPEAGEQVLSAETMPEGCEFLGDGFDSLEHYFRTELEDFVGPPIRWLLDCLDWHKIRMQFEADRYRYIWESGSVYRVAVDE